MKAICIIGSPRKNGSTIYLADTLIGGMKSEKVQVSRFILSDLRIDYCMGCRKCESRGRCVQDDDMNGLLAAILESDIIIMASPSYWGDVTGQMKVFIDRSLPLCNAKTGKTQVPHGKIGVAIAIRAGQSKAENQDIVNTFRHYFGHLGISLAASLTAEGINGLADIKSNTAKLKEAFELGRNISKTLGNSKAGG